MSQPVKPVQIENIQASTENRLDTDAEWGQ